MKFKKSSVQAPTIHGPKKLLTVWVTDDVNVSVWFNVSQQVQVEIYDAETGERVVMTALPDTEIQTAPSGEMKVVCDRCDGCGWYEGGVAIKTHCEKCDGTGIEKSKNTTRGV